MSNPYDRNGHRAADNCLSTFCTSCGRQSSYWGEPCDHKAASANEYDEYGYITRRAVY